MISSILSAMSGDDDVSVMSTVSDTSGFGAPSNYDDNDDLKLLILYVLRSVYLENSPTPKIFFSIYYVVSISELDIDLLGVNCTLHIGSSKNL